MQSRLTRRVLDMLSREGPLSAKKIAEKLSEEKEVINSLLYGPLRELVIRDVNETGYPEWRVKTKSFEAAKGLEMKLVTLLLQKHIISQNNSQVDYPVENRRNGKLYHLDIAVITGEKKWNIEVDGFDHVRADARYSIQKQIEKKGENTQEIDIDWMDHERSYIDFSLIDNEKVFAWMTRRLDWCIRFHEELIWPDDINRNIWLIENGWQVMRFWNVEVKNDPEKCAEQVKRWLLS